MKYLFFLFFAFPAFSQKNYIDYHNEIILAEKQFLNDDFTSSVKMYRTIFEAYEKPFVKDIYIAAEIATLAQDSSSLLYFLALGFKKGLPFRVVENDMNISTYLSTLSQKSISLLKENFLINRAYYLNHINIPLRYEMLLMNNKDQLYHEFPHDVKISIDKDSQYASVLDENLNKIVEIVKTYGYPGENLIGIKDKKDENVSHYTSYEDDLNEISPIFFYHNACCFQILSEGLYNAILTGDIHPREYAMIYEWSFNHFKNIKDTSGIEIEMDGQRQKIKPTILPIKNCKIIDETERYNICKMLTFSKPEPVSNEKINADRGKIGIATLAHDELKKRFEQNRHIKLFFGMFEEL